MRVASALAASVCLICLGATAPAARRPALDLPGGPLADAMLALGQRARISIGLREPALARIQVRPVRGARSAEAALRLMLAGTAATAVRIGPAAWIIVRAPPPRRRSSTVRPARPAPRPVPAIVVSPTPSPAEPQLVVTASKRRIRLADYPGMVALVDGADPLLDGLRGSEALLERVPSLTSTHLGSGRNKLFIRGIADSSFNGPTQATVGQYLGETRLNYNAPDPDLRLYDIERVEILAGPQGTLYGAGSLGGVIRTLPNPPDLADAQAAILAGAAVTAHGEPGADLAGMINLPLAPDAVALRLVGYAEREGGYIDDLARDLEDVNRTRTIGGRAALRARTDSGWQFDVGLAGQRIRGADSQFADRDGPPLTRESLVGQPFGSDYLLVQAAASRNWGDLQLVTTLGHVRQRLAERYDATVGARPPAVFDQTSRIRMLASETRLSRSARDGSGWLLGTSLLGNRMTQSRALGDPALPAPITGVRNAVTEATLFGEASIKLAPAILLAAGARLTRSQLSGAALDAPPAVRAQIAPLEADRSETILLPTLAITAQAAPDFSLFLRYQQGFRPGGLAVTGQVIQRFRNDRVQTAEAGLRYRRGGEIGFDTAMAVAHTRWQDIQADIIDFSGLPTTQNIGDGRIWTLDLQLGWRPVAGLTFDLGAVLNQSRVTNPAPSVIISPTAPLPNVAGVNARFGADYLTALGAGLDLRLSTSARYVGRSRLGIGPILGAPQGDWLDTRLAVRLEAARHSLSLTLGNALDETGNRFALGSPFSLVDRRQITPLRPRTLRLGWDLRF